MIENNASNNIIKNYLDKINFLLSNVKDWCDPFGIQAIVNQTSINEDPYGQYNAPTLVLKLHDGKHLAEVSPFGAAVLGAMGRIDIVGEYGKREKIVYLSAGGPAIITNIQASVGDEKVEKPYQFYRGVDSEGWYWVAPFPLRRAYPITKEIFLDLLSAVSGHEL